LCSLHQVHFAQQFADRIVGLSQGKVATDAATTDFDRQAANRLYGAPAVRG
jgi:phosphonate transport system ATP-binding protein